jgi:hypothetical protein
MTALNPIEKMGVRGVAAYSYPLNEICAVPDCWEPTMDPHHIFPRSKIGNESWFVQLHDPFVQKGRAHWIIPHVIGLCRMHHDDVEEHRAWIKLEDNPRGGMWFVWYAHNDENWGRDNWTRVRPLDPQPALAQKQGKRKRAVVGPPKVKKVFSVKCPVSEEDGIELLRQAIEDLEGKMGYDPKRSPYYTLMDALNFAMMWIGGEDEQGRSREVEENGQPPSY